MRSTAGFTAWARGNEQRVHLLRISTLITLLLLPAPTLPAQSAQSPAFTAAELDLRLPRQLRDSMQLMHLSVPRDHRQPNGARFNVAVAVVKARASNVQKEPVVFIPGGPGLSGIEMYVRGHRDGSHPFDRFREDRPLVIIDPRGFGFSEPNICAGMLDDEPLTPDGGAEQEWLSKLTDCRARMLEDGIDPRTLSAAQAARDLDWLRRALGAQQLNLFGASYGSRIAFEAIERIPASLRAVFVFGPVPPDKFRGSGDPLVAQEALEAMFRACASQPSCNGAYPRLRDDFATALAHVRQTPLHVREDFVVTEQVLSQGLAQMLASRRLGEGVPLLIHTIAREGNSIVARIAVALETSFRAGRGSPGLGLAFWCNDGVVSAASSGPMQRRCERLVGAVQPTDSQHLIGDVPVLISVGQLDPLTPPSFANDIAGRTPNLRTMVLRSWGHELPPECNFRIAAEFFQNPDAALDTRCLAKAPVMRFVTGADADEWITDVAVGPRWSRRQKLLMVAALLALVALAVFIVRRDRTLPMRCP